MAKHSITIGWLYFDLMNTYGDRGNIMILKNRLLARGIDAHIKQITLGDDGEEIAKCDLLFMGGAQDRQQTIVHQDLLKKKKYLVDAIHGGVPGIYVCGAYQLLGNYYIAADGERLEGLGILDLYTQAPKNGVRLVGDIIIQTSIADIENNVIIGFENHGGLTYLGTEMSPLGTVKHGYGNNGKDKTEGIIYKNTLGTYLHGPLFSKNPHLADWIIGKALEIKYQEKVILHTLDDTFEQKAKDKLLTQYS